MGERTAKTPARGDQKRPEAYDAPATPANGEGTIPLSGGRLPTIAAEVQAALLHKKSETYEREGELVQPAVLPEPTEINSTEVAEEALLILPVESPWLFYELKRVGRFAQWDRRSDSWQAKDCPKRAADTLLGLAGNWRFFRAARHHRSPDPAAGWPGFVDVTANPF